MRTSQKLVHTNLIVMRIVESDYDQPCEETSNQIGVNYERSMELKCHTWNIILDGKYNCFRLKDPFLIVTSMIRYTLEQNLSFNPL
jgi:hypothetical protein